MSDPDVSIIIPVFNRADLVAKAIDSALAQTRPCEVVVTDHGSTDAIADVVAHYGERIRYVRKDRDDGPFLAWLDGVLNARGEFIHFTYDDDWIAPEFIEKTMAKMTDDTGIVFTDAYVVSETGETRIDTAKLVTDGVWPSAILRKRILNTRFAVSPGCALLRRKDALDALMCNPLTTLSDYRGVGPDLMLYLVPAARYPKFAYVAEPLAYFKAHAGSITVDAVGDTSKKKALIRGYREYQAFFRLAALQGRPLARKLPLWLSRLLG